MVERYNPDARFAFITKAVAESSFGIRVPQETLDRWTILAKGCGIADDVIDTTVNPTERQQVTDSLIGYVEGSYETILSEDPSVTDLMEPVRTVYQALPKKNQKTFIRHLRIFGRATERARNETDIRKYSKLKMLEGQLNMELFHDTAPETMKSHPNFFKYRKTVNRMIRARNNLDALIDLKEDLAQGTTQIQPTLFNKLYLLKDTIVQAVKSIRGFNIDVFRKIVDQRS